VFGKILLFHLFVKENGQKMKKNHIHIFDEFSERRNFGNFLRKKCIPTVKLMNNIFWTLSLRRQKKSINRKMQEETTALSYQSVFLFILRSY